MSASETWGWLVTMTEPVRMYDLSSSFTVGRDPSLCTLFIDEDLFERIGINFKNEKYVGISRRHFEIEKKDGEASAVITDLSMNGTWVNGVRVGKDKQMILAHCSVISLFDLDGDCFSFLDRNTMVAIFPSCLTRKYIVGGILGKGTTSEVRMGYVKEDNEIKTYALKILSTKDDCSEFSDLADSAVEIQIMSTVSHPCILKLHEVITGEDKIILVMEHAVGGELFEAVVNDRNANRISEHTTKAYFYQIVHCVNYLHRRKLCHRDLKLENILLGGEKIGNISNIKVADFGFSKYWSGDSGALRTYGGTPVYMAPEVSQLEHGEQSYYPPYSYKVDCWSLGVLLYTMLCGRRPFSSRSDLHTQIMAGRYRPMEGPLWENVSAAAKNLTKKLLDVDPRSQRSSSTGIETQVIPSGGSRL